MVTLAAIAAILAGGFAISKPMSQRLDFLERVLTAEEGRNKEHALLQQHPGAQAHLSAMKERFSEVETQFKGLREVADVRLAKLDEAVGIIQVWRFEHEARVRALDAAQWERIKAIERALYGTVGVESK